MAVLLSDGSPNFLDCAVTTVGEPDVHRQVIRAANLYGAVVHTFGIGVGADADARIFMQGVADDSGGVYVELP